jgi:hypothetical protein
VLVGEQTSLSSSLHRRLRAYVGHLLSPRHFPKADVAYSAPTDLEGQLAAVVGSDAHIRFSM